MKKSLTRWDESAHQKMKKSLQLGVPFFWCLDAIITHLLGEVAQKLAFHSQTSFAFVDESRFSLSDQFDHSVFEFRFDHFEQFRFKMVTDKSNYRRVKLCE